MPNQTCIITFRVHAPETNSNRDIIFITGNHPRLGKWKPNAVELQRRAKGYWERTLEFPKNARLSYKITRGSWETEEVLENGIVRANRYLTVKKHQIVDIRVANWRDLVNRPASAITGTVKYHESFRSRYLTPRRTLVVWLPPSYNRTTRKRYPVLYMHDGQNIFDPATAFAGVEWQVDETADRLIRQKKIEEIIVVGIYNSPDRLKEYSDTPKGRRYMRFLITEVKPFIDITYRTKADRDDTAVMGSSMGGLISLYLLWKHPEVFSKAGCFSSTLGWRKGEVLRMISRTKHPPNDVRIYFDHGGTGGETSGLPYFRKFKKLLLQKGLKEGKDFVSFFDKEGDHSEAAWAKRLWRPLIFLFGLNNPPSTKTPRRKVGDNKD
ncbi:MAG TPA: alpha/beta hydrolase-fold protein [bacterium]